jgi:hypothetical protein
MPDFINLQQDVLINKRLDELDFFQVEHLYTNLTNNILDSVILTTINKKIESQYKELKIC